MVIRWAQDHVTTPALSRLRGAQLLLAYRRKQRVQYPHAPFIDDKVAKAAVYVVIALSLLWFEQTGEVPEPYSSPLEKRKSGIWSRA